MTLPDAQPAERSRLEAPEQDARARAGFAMDHPRLTFPDRFPSPENRSPHPPRRIPAGIIFPMDDLCILARHVKQQVSTIHAYGQEYSSDNSNACYSNQ